MSAVQVLGLVKVSTGDQPDTGMLPKPVAAAVLTLTQRDDGHVMIFHQTMSAEDEMQCPLPWLFKQALIAGPPTLLGAGDAQVLLADAAQHRFFVEPRLASLTTGEHVVAGATLAGEGAGEAAVPSARHPAARPRSCRSGADMDRGFAPRRARHPCASMRWQARSPG